MTLVHKGNIQKFTEGAFREWGYEVATEEFREQTVTERESWILGNVEAKPGITIEENAALIEPGMEFAPQSFREQVYAEVKAVLDSIGETHGKGAWKQKILVNDRIADSIFQQIIIRPADYFDSGHFKSEWGLHFGCGGGAGGRTGDCAGSEYRRRVCGVRGDARDGAEVRGQGRDQPGIGDSFGGDDAGVSSAGRKRPG